MLEAKYFDGRSTRLRLVGLSLAGGVLRVEGEDLAFSWSFIEVKVDERLGRAARRLRFPDGGFCEVADLDGLDALLAEAGHRDGPVDRLQRSLKIALVAALACLVLAFSAYRWGLPIAAQIGARHLPTYVGRILTTQTLGILEGKLLLPSKLSGDRQAVLTERYRALHLPEGGAPTGKLLFRESPSIGANAFTLPDGTIILLDGLVEAMKQDDQIVAVLAHELGHAHGHHGLQMLLRSSAIGAFWVFYVGDVSQLLAGAPTILMQAHYSRGLEQEADEYGASLLTANNLSPALLADALETLSSLHKGSGIPAYLASHPPTEERIQALRGSRP